MEKTEMLESVKNYLSYFGDINFNIIRSMDFVDRSRFHSDFENVYNDVHLPFGSELILRPSLLGRMIQLLDASSGNSVLEVGAGSGWGAGVLAHLVYPGKVHSLDVSEDFISRAKQNLSSFGFDNLDVSLGDFFDIGISFDRIIFTCGVERDEEKIVFDWIFEHLNEGGVCICPYVEGPIMILRKEGGKFYRDFTREEYFFSPIKS